MGSSMESTITSASGSTLGLSLLSNPGLPDRRRVGRDVGQAGLDLPVRLVNHDEFADGARSSQLTTDWVAAPAELDAPTGGSTSAQVTADGGLGLSSLSFGYWMALGLPLLLLPFLFLMRRRKRRKNKPQVSYPW